MKILIAVLVVGGGMALGASGQSGGTVTVKQDPVDRVMDSVVQMDRDRKALEIERQKLEVQREQLRLEQERFMLEQQKVAKRGDRVDNPVSGDMSLWPDLHSAIFRGDYTNVVNILQRGYAINGKDKDGNTPLLTAAQYGRLNIIHYLLDNGADVNASNIDGMTPLLYAIWWERLDGIRYLVGKGADLEMRDNTGETPLIRAVLAGKLDFVRWLVENGADVNALDERSRLTPLMIAAYRGESDIVKYMADKGSGVDGKHEDGWPYIVSLAAQGKLEALRELVDNGADVNAASDNEGHTALMMAAFGGHQEIVDYLKAHGATK